MTHLPESAEDVRCREVERMDRMLDEAAEWLLSARASNALTYFISNTGESLADTKTRLQKMDRREAYELLRSTKGVGGKTSKEIEEWAGLERYVPKRPICPRCGQMLRTVGAKKRASS